MKEPMQSSGTPVTTWVMSPADDQVQVYEHNRACELSGIKEVGMLRNIASIMCSCKTAAIAVVALSMLPKAAAMQEENNGDIEAEGLANLQMQMCMTMMLVCGMMQHMQSLRKAAEKREPDEEPAPKRRMCPEVLYRDAAKKVHEVQQPKTTKLRLCKHCKVEGQRLGQYVLYTPKGVCYHNQRCAGLNNANVVLAAKVCEGCDGCSSSTMSRRRA